MPAAGSPRLPTFPHPEPREYHQMYRTWSYHWWRPVVGLLLLAAGLMVIVPLVMLPLLAVGVLVENGREGFGDAFVSAGLLEKITPAALLYMNLTLAALILWTWGLARVLHRMRPRWLSSVVPKLRWRYLFACLGLSVIALGAAITFGAFLPVSETPEVTGMVEVNSTTVALAVVILLFTPLQAAGEEYAFRGYLLQAVGSLVRNRWVAIAVSATLFALAHGDQNPPLFFDRLMFGLIAAWLVIRTGGLEAGIALHVVNNVLAMGAALVFGDLTESLTVTHVSWWNIPVTLVQSAVYAGLAAWVASRMGLQTRTRPPRHDPVVSSAGMVAVADGR